MPLKEQKSRIAAARIIHGRLPECSTAAPGVVTLVEEHISRLRSLPMSYDTEETWEDESDQWDDDDDYGDDDEEEPTILCPYCRAEVWEEASQCPKCGEYLSLEDRQARHEWRPRWIVLTAALLLLLILLGYLSAFSD